MAKPGIRGGPSGDLYVVMHVKEHEIFQREEDNLFAKCRFRSPSPRWAEKLPCRLSKGKANIKVPAGTQSGQVFKLRNRGIVNVNGRGRGDLLARLLVEVPTHLNGEQRLKLEEFSALCGEEKRRSTSFSSQTLL